LKKVTIIGGGLSGLVTAIQLVRHDIHVQLFEKKSYPFHRVCGEYVSNEVVPFLQSLDLFPAELSPVPINRLQLTSTNGRAAELPLDLGGFGISRYNFDNWLFQKALAEGVDIVQETEINKVIFSDESFKLFSHHDSYTAALVIGSFGKRSKIDVTLNRPFIKSRSPYIGVKYHIRTDHPKNLIGLHNFKDGYCGISCVENDVVNLCYLSHAKNLKRAGSIKELEESILFSNPLLKTIFRNAEFVLDSPVVINEISFETKNPVENHVLMSGDAAGMITPLCGNGMAMAIHSSKILSDLVIQFCDTRMTRLELESAYSSAWSKQFARRLWVGRQLQKLFGSTLASDLAVNIALHAQPVASYLVAKTHGDPF